MPRKYTRKKTTVRHKKNRKGAVVETRIAHGTERWEALAPPPEFTKPQNRADAWDAMKMADELPNNYRFTTVNPFRAEQDRADEFVTTYRPLDKNDRPTYDPTRQVARDVHQSSDPIIPLCPLWNWNGCPHLLDGGNSAIQWMEHSQGIITGVCAHCPTQFDTRHDEHLELFLANPKAEKYMGRAMPGSVAGRGVGSVYGTPWQIFVYTYFAWVYSVKVWLRNKYRVVEKYIRTDF